MAKGLLAAVDLLERIDPRLAARARHAAAWVHEQKGAGRTVTVVHHIDADGVTAGAIALEALSRADCPHRSVPAKSLDDVHIDALQGGGHEALWFCDFGSTAYMHFQVPRLVCDHHQLVRDGTEEDFPHVNPLLDGLEGDEISGAGCAYLVAHALDPENLDLVPVALVGATGDLQNRGGFHGTNQHLLDVGTEHGILRAGLDLAFFGPETRDLRTFLAYADVDVPGATGSRRTAERFLADLDVDCRQSWSALDEDARLAVRSALVHRLLDCGRSIEGLFREVLTLAKESPGTPVHEMQEFGTLLNSTARYDEPDVGLAVARGDRDVAYKEALSLRDDHKKHLVKSLDAFAKQGIRETDALQWVHLEDHVRDTVVGIVCGMALDGLGLRRDRPLIGFAHTPDGRTKVSSRAPHELKGRIDLATAMREGSAVVGGQGGGHEGAAGATIPRGAEPQFLDAVDAVVGQQLGLTPGKTVRPRGQMQLF